MFNPTVGRFTSEDPKGFAAGDANLYRYVNNGPTNATDPSGMWIVTRVEEDAETIKAKVESWIPGLKLTIREANEGKPAFMYLIDEVNDPVGMRMIADAVAANAAAEPGSAKEEKHNILAALQHNSRPHVDIAVIDIDPVTKSLDYVLGVNHVSPIPAANARLDAMSVPDRMKWDWPSVKGLISKVAYDKNPKDKYIAQLAQDLLNEIKEGSIEIRATTYRAAQFTWVASPGSDRPAWVQSGPNCGSAKVPGQAAGGGRRPRAMIYLNTEISNNLAARTLIHEYTHTLTFKHRPKFAAHVESDDTVKMEFEQIAYKMEARFAIAADLPSKFVSGGPKGREVDFTTIDLHIKQYYLAKAVNNKIGDVKFEEMAQEPPEGVRVK